MMVGPMGRIRKGLPVINPYLGNRSRVGGGSGWTSQIGLDWYLPYSQKSLSS